MQIIRLFVFLLIHLALVQAQDFSFTATVVDENGLPLEYAILALSDSVETKRLSSNSDGVIRFRVIKNRKYKAVATRGNRIPMSWAFQAEGDVQQTFTLLPKDQVDLDSLVITANRSIIYKKDTTIYTLEAFTNKSERRLKDALVKLPGFSLDKGVLRMNGKLVNKIMVEDKEFFGNNKRIALEKLPAGAIEKVEAIENYSESSIRAGQKNNQVVLNLRLKGNKKNIIFGDLNAGLGIDKRYENSANLFYFGKTSINLIASNTNTAKPSLTSRDLIEIYGGFSQFLNLNVEDVFKEIFSGPLAEFTTTQNDVQRQENFLGLNLNHEFNSKWNMDAFLMANDLNVLQKNNQDIQYLNNNEVFASESRTTQNNLDQQNAIAKIKTKYTPSARSEVFGNALFSYVNAQPNKRTIQFFNAAENNLNTRSQNSDWRAQANAEWHRKYNNRHRGFFGWEGVWSKKESETIYESNQNLFPSELELLDADLFRLRQNLRPQGAHTSLSYQHIYDHTARKKWTIDVELNRNRHGIRSNLEQLLANNTSQNLLPINDSDFRRSHALFGVTYAYSIKRLSFDFGARFRHIATLQDFGTSQRTVNVTENFLAPYFQFRYNFRTSEKLRLTYEFKPTAPDFSYLLQNQILQSFSSVRLGNPNLANERFHDLKLYYMKNLRFYNFSLNNTFNYRFAEKGVLFLTEQEGFTAAQSLALFENPNSQWSNRLNVTKGFLEEFTLQLQQTTGQSRARRFFNGNEIQNRNLQLRTRLKLEYKPTKSVLFSYELENEHRVFESDELRNTSRTWRHDWRVDIQFLQYFNFKTDFVLTHLRDVRGQRNRFSDANLELSHFHQEKRLSYSVRLQNVFNNASRVSNSLSEQTLERSELFLQERFLLFRVGWKF